MPTLFASHTSLPSHFKAQLTLFPTLYCELHFLETPAFPKEQTKMGKNARAYTHTRTHKNKTKRSEFTSEKKSAREIERTKEKKKKEKRREST
jgi:hypothetical protein